MEEQGAQRASYALKLLQSEGELTIASTGKDPITGRMVTHEYRVQGPVMIFLTTTAIEIDEELLNRCLILTVDEGREQTRAIHQLQREKYTLEGMLARQNREAILKLHQNAQRLLRSMEVTNPYSRQLTFLDDKTRTRRDHLKYLGLINTLAFLHQYQRPTKTIGGIECIEATLDDIAVANRLANEVLGRSLDELPPQAMRLLGMIGAMVKQACERLEIERSDYRFSRTDVRQYTGWSDFQIKIHMKKLEELEYLLVHRGGRGQSFVYELLYDGEGQNGNKFLMGLIDVEQLRQGYDVEKEHQKEKLEGSSSPQVAPKEPPSRPAHFPLVANKDRVFERNGAETAQKTYIGGEKNHASYGGECRNGTPLPHAVGVA